MTPAADNRRPTREAVKRSVLDLLDAAGTPLTTWEVALALGRKVTDEAVRLSLNDLVASGEVQKEKAGHKAAMFWTEREEGS